MLTLGEEGLGKALVKDFFVDGQKFACAGKTLEDRLKAIKDDVTVKRDGYEESTLVVEGFN